MQLISLGRGQGKTALTLQWFLVDPENRGILTASYQEAERLRRLAQQQMQTPLPQNAIIPFGSDNIRGQRRQWAIDNLDLILSVQVGHVGPITYTAESDRWQSEGWRSHPMAEGYPS